MKALDRLIEILPVPLLVGVAAICLAAWLTKEMRLLPNYGASVKDPYFQIAALLIALSIVAYYGAAAIWTNRIPGSSTEHNVYVARFDGDATGAVQKHTIESLQTAIWEDDTRRHIRVRPLDREIEVDSAAASPELHRYCVVYGTFIPPSTVHYKFLSGPGGLERRKTVPSFPDIQPLPPMVVEAVAKLHPADDGLDVALHEELAALRNDNTQLARQLEEYHRELKALRLRTSNAPEVRSLQSRVANHYRIQRKHVLSIGINTYNSMPSLVSAVPDAKLVGDTFSRLYPNAASSQILLNEEASRASILSTLHRLADEAKEEDQVVVYYAGHGVTKDGVGYLIPADTDPGASESTGLSMFEVGRLFSKIKAKQKVMLVDACYAGAFDVLTRSLQVSESFERLLIGAGEVVITAGTETQAVADSTALGHGLFTYHLVEGLTGAADADGDGLVTITELYAYVQRRLMDETGQWGFEQTPQMHARSLTDFVVGIVDDFESDTAPSVMSR